MKKRTDEKQQKIFFALEGREVIKETKTKTNNIQFWKIHIYFFAYL